MSTATEPLESSVGVAAQLRALEDMLVGLAPELVPERITKGDLAGVVRSLGRIERCAAGARIVLTKAAADVGAWKGQGFRSSAEWAARANGTTVGQAAADLEASGQLEGLPATRDAVGSGELSADAAKAVAAGATADRSLEQDLLAKGKAGDLTGARIGARRARQRADERDGKAAERMYRRRQLRMWVEVDGEGRGQWNVPPAYQATFLAALEPYRQEAFRQARAAGQRPSAEALMADALQLLCLDVLADLDLPIPDGARPRDPATGPGAHDSGDGSPDGHGDTPSATDAGGQNSSDGGPGVGGSGPSAATAATDAATTEGDPTSTGDPGPTGAESGTGDRGAEPGPTGAKSGAADGEAEPGPTGPGAPGPSDSMGPAGTRRKKAPRHHRRAPAQISFHIDVAAWLRGRSEGDEICEIPGLGPVPVTLTKAFANDATLKLIVRHGDDITTITSHRRYVPAALRTALEARDLECVVPGCHATRGLQIDHIHDFAKDGPTALDNNALICVFHHYLKTHCHWVLRGPPGHWTFTPPDTS